MKISVTEIASRADAFYAARDDVRSVSQSLELLEAALTSEFDYELAWRAGRALFFLGQEAESEARARERHARAIEVCGRAAGACPARVEGHFWLGVNLALLAALENPLSALWHALKARCSLHRAISIDPAYHAAGPLRVLARLEARLPTVFGGGYKRARAHFERAVAIAPNNTVTRLYFAELLAAAGEQPRARQQLEALLNAPPDPAWAFEIARDRRLAEAMLKNLSPKSKVQSPKSS
ncbi:MAG TPA: TRAP transporter TatT component family protein [Pyrinomonadaceae bacterium]